MPRHVVSLVYIERDAWRALGVAIYSVPLFDRRVSEWGVIMLECGDGFAVIRGRDSEIGNF